MSLDTNKSDQLSVAEMLAVFEADNQLALQLGRLQFALEQAPTLNNTKDAVYNYIGPKPKHISGLSVRLKKQQGELMYKLSIIPESNLLQIDSEEIGPLAPNEIMRVIYGFIRDHLRSELRAQISDISAE